MSLKAVIFDLNGTVLSDEDEYGAAFRMVLAKLGKKVDKRFPHIRGIGVKENWPRLLAKYHIKTNMSLEELEQATQEAYLTMLSKIQIRKGFRRFISRLRQRDIKTALATSNSYFIVEKIFDELGLGKYFDVITTNDEIAFNKPSPEIFLTTADRLGLDPSYCTVIEDSEAGIEAAKSAGMRTIGIATDPENKKKLSGADFVVGNFDQVRLGFENLSSRI